MFKSYQSFLESAEYIQLELNPDYDITKYFIKNLEDAKETVFDDMLRNLTEFLATIGCETLDTNMEIKAFSNFGGHIIFENKGVYFYLCFKESTEISLYDVSKIVENRGLDTAKKIKYHAISSYIKLENSEIKNVVGPYIIMKFKDIATVIKNYHNKKNIIT